MVDLSPMDGSLASMGIGTSRVHIARVDSDEYSQIDASLRHALNDLPQPDWDRSKPVYVKVNGLCESSPEEGYDTHPQVAVTTADWFRGLGYDVMIGDNFGRKLLDPIGVGELADRHGIPLHDSLSDLVECPIEGGFLLEKTMISKTVLESHPVSVPKFKTHLESIMSLSLKNMKGCIGGRLDGEPEDERIRYHRIGMHECIADMNKAIRPKMAVVDCLKAMQGIGPARAMSSIKRLGLLIIGYDAVAVDTVCCRISGAEPGDVRHIHMAALHGLGTDDEGRISVTGVPLDEARAVDFELPPTDPSEISPVKGIELILGKTCSNCVSALATALVLLADKGFKVPEDIVLELVAGVEPPLAGKARGPRVYVGRCLKDACDGRLARGCPPAATFIVEAIEEVINIKEMIA